MKFNDFKNLDWKEYCRFSGYHISIIEHYFRLYKFSPYKNLFDDNVFVTLNKDVTMHQINHYWYPEIKYEYDNINHIIKINDKKIDDMLEITFDFLGWKKINDYLVKAKYEIIDPYEWLKNHDDKDKPETMYFNDKNISYFDYRHILGHVDFNTNILSDCCDINYKDSIFYDLFNKNISIDGRSTILQMMTYFPDVIYNYDEQNNLIHIKRKRLNEWNKLLETLFKFYGWYPKDDRTLYPKYDIIDLNKYILDHKKIKFGVIIPKELNIDYDLLNQYINNIINENNVNIIKFIYNKDNKICKLYCDNNNLVSGRYAYECDYHTYGKKAEYIVNEKIIKYCDICLIFKDDDVNKYVDLCDKFNKKYYIINI